MSLPEFSVSNLDITHGNLKVETAVVYDECPFSPKVRIIFRKGNDVRRLPVILKSQFEKGNGKKLAIFSYTYQLDYVFTGKNDLSDYTVEFELTLGDDCFEPVPVTVSEGLFHNLKDFNLNKSFISGTDFEGVNVFVKEADEDEAEETSSYIYHLIPELENNRFIIKSELNQNAACEGFSYKFFSFLSAFFTLLYLIILLPYYVIDGILAALGIVPRRSSPECEGFLKNTVAQIKANCANFIKSNIKFKNTAMKIIAFRDTYYEHYYKKLCKKPVVKNRIAFISGRRDELGGNEKFVYDLIKDREDIEFKFLFSTELDRFTKSHKKKEFYRLFATSKIVIVDDYYNLLNTVEKRPDVTLFQLWHACGAFKTFGFSRLGKPGSPKQKNPNHRMYDYTIVSSSDIIKFYAEGFGISDYKVLPTGIPRTDIFCDNGYGKAIKDGFFEKYPTLKGKKIIMFAPTFRGAGQNSAYYPVSAFEPNEFMKDVGEDYAIIIKLHPFCSEKFTIDDEYKDRIIDLSDEDEINDLLFITDILITDYSSCVFEASMLDIPMLFYAFDLYSYIAGRDFYCDFESFIPGKLVFTQEQMAQAVKGNDFDQSRIAPFKEKFFNNIDGKASERVAEKILTELAK